MHMVIGLVAQWITRRSTEPKIAGSTPAEVAIFRTKRCQLILIPRSLNRARLNSVQ
uniref:Uncharacterized protein n=1 Tax=Onchocerca volvulus TaxID=6282 RepID=A0A8R1TXC6_ONCVO